uniref:Uncharacterized protein n=6 Tax=Oryza TaxID=4527 RepID=Q851Q3_ORYSJ|nr:hypothetical protein [Oryza sativa Japonica Group]
MAMGKYAAYGDLLGMTARVAVRAYSHCPQTARMYYKPPPTATATTAASGDKRSASAATASSSRSSSFGADNAGSSTGAAASPCASTKQQAAAAARVAFDGAGFILYGVERAASPSPAAAAVVCTVAIHCRRLEASGSTRPRLGGRGDSGSTAWIREEGATSAARPPTSCIFCWRGGFWGSGGLRCLCLCLPGPPSSLPFAAATIAIVCGGEGPTAREAGEERIRVMHPAGSVPSPLDVRCCSRARLTCPPSPWAPTRRRCRSPSPHAHASRRRLARPRLARTQVVVAVAVAVAAPR